MKYVLFFLTLLAANLYSQSTLTFDKRFVQCEDKWVAFKADKDGSHTYGFIYIDPQAGLTFNREGTFRIGSAGEFIPQEPDTTRIKIRLEPNNVQVAFIPETRFQELKITSTPEWLKFYKTDSGSVERLYQWGYTYNGWGECERALTYLEKAYAINPVFQGLAVELSYSYNCLKQYDKAESILEEEIKTNASDAYVNKEYIYTLSKNNKIGKAITQFETSSKNLKDNPYNAENCFNILQYYYTQKDKGNFNKWYKVLQKLPNDNTMITKYADSMKADINK